MLVEPDAPGVDGVEPLSALQSAPAPQDATVFVGPEGGWTQEEIRATVVGWDKGNEARFAAFIDKLLAEKP